MRTDSLPRRTDTENRVSIASVVLIHVGSVWCQVFLGLCGRARTREESDRFENAGLRNKKMGISSLTVKIFDASLSNWMGNAKDSSDLSHAHF